MLHWRMKMPETPAGDPLPDIPRVLSVRLHTPPLPIKFGFVLGLVVTAMSYGMWLIAKNTKGGDGSIVLWIFAIVFGLLGILLVWSSIRQFIIARTPPTIVEISDALLIAGRAARIALIQPGPAKLKSLRANLVCLEQHIRWREREDSEGRTESYREVDEKMIHTENLIEARDVRALNGDHWQELREFVMPADARASSSTDSHAIIWRIELWGKGPFFGSFMRPFEIKVARGSH